jgi:hypothetical protein
MLTSGLNTIWSQCVLTGLIEAFHQGVIDQPMSLDTWKGTSKMKPCFAGIRQGANKLSNKDLYEELGHSRRQGDKARLTTLLKDAVSVLEAHFGVNPEIAVVVTEEELGSDY